MGKNKNKLQSHHLYLGAGGVLAVVALFIALNWGVTSAQTPPPMPTCTAPMYLDYATNTCVSPPSTGTCMYGGTYPNCNPMTTPDPTCTAPMYLDSSTHTCVSPPSSGSCMYGGTYPNCNSMPNSDSSSPYCVSPAIWASDICMNGSNFVEPVACPAGSSLQPGNSQHGNIRWCGPGGSSTTTTTTPTTGGSYCVAPYTSWDSNLGVCWNGPTMIAPVSCPAGQTIQPASPTHGNVSWCGTGSTATTTSTGSSYCLSSYSWDSYMGVCWTGPNGTIQVAPTSCPSGQMFQSPNATHTVSWCGTSTSTPMSGGLYPCPQMPGSPMVTAEECGRNTPVCGPGQDPMRNMCKYADANPSMMGNCGTGYYWDGRACMPSTNTMNPMPVTGTYQPGTCPADMLSCPNTYGGTGNSCYAKDIWDYNGNAMRPATCADFSSPMMGPGTMMPYPPMPTMPYFGEMRPAGEFVDPCAVNPNDFLCRGGFDFNKFQQDQADAFKFDQNQFDPMQYQVRNVKQEVRNLKREAKEWSRDAKQARRQLVEVGRESGSFTCPAAIEVDALIAELEKAASTVNALSDSSDEASVQTGLAMREHINGRYDMELGEQTVGIRGQLYGGPPDPDTGEPTPGKIQGLNVCREIAGAISRAGDVSRMLEREYKNLQNDNVPAEMLAAFDEVLPQIKEIATNPLKVLSDKGVSIETLSEPWMPDPEVCNFGGFGGFNRGPFPMSMGGGMGGGPGFGGGPNFGGFPGPDMMGSFEGFSPELMQKAMEKYQEFQGTGGFNMPGGFSFQNSILTYQPNPYEDDDFGDDEFDEDFPEMEEMDDECMPPVQRYLGFEKLMMKLDQARRDSHRHLETMNACELFEMGKAQLDKESTSGRRSAFGPPPEVRELLEEGLQACENGDMETVEMLREEMFRIGRLGGRGRMKGIGGLVDVDQLIEDKIREKLAGLDEFIAGEDDDRATIKRLQALLDDANKRMTELTSALSENQKLIFSMKEELATMTSQLAASSIEVSSTVLGTIADIPNETVQQEVAATIGALAEQTNALKEVIEANVDAKTSAAIVKELDETMTSLIQSPPTEAALTNIQEGLIAIQSYALSGAKDAEVKTKAQEELAMIVVQNVADTDLKVAQELVPYKDVANLNDWFTSEVMKSRHNGFAAAPDQLPNGFQPDQPELVAAAAVRIGRLLEKTGEIAKIDLNDLSLVTPVPGAPDWAKPYIRELQERGVALPDSPTAVADRADVALLIHQALPEQFPTPANIAEYLTSDTLNLSLAEREAIAAVRAGGIMGVGSDTFNPNQDFNRAQGATVVNRLYDTLLAAEESPAE